MAKQMDLTHTLPALVVFDLANERHLHLFQIRGLAIMSMSKKSMSKETVSPGSAEELQTTVYLYIDISV